MDRRARDALNIKVALSGAWRDVTTAHVTRDEALGFKETLSFPLIYGGEV